MIRAFRLRPTLFALLAALALLLRAGIPAGWMPSVSDEGGVRIAICTGQGGATMVLGGDGRLRQQAPARQTPRDPCPYGLASAQAADLPPVFALAAPPAEPGLLVQPQPAAAALVAARQLRPPARGPPAFA